MEESQAKKQGKYNTKRERQREKNKQNLKRGGETEEAEENLEREKQASTIHHSRKKMAAIKHSLCHSQSLAVDWRAAFPLCGRSWVTQEGSGGVLLPTPPPPSPPRVCDGDSVADGDDGDGEGPRAGGRMLRDAGPLVGCWCMEEVGPAVVGRRPTGAEAIKGKELLRRGAKERGLRAECDPNSGSGMRGSKTRCISIPPAAPSAEGGAAGCSVCFLISLPLTWVRLRILDRIKCTAFTRLKVSAAAAPPPAPPPSTVEGRPAKAEEVRRLAPPLRRGLPPPAPPEWWPGAGS